MVFCEAGTKKVCGEPESRGGRTPLSRDHKLADRKATHYYDDPLPAGNSMFSIEVPNPVSEETRKAPASEETQNIMAKRSCMAWSL